MRYLVALLFVSLALAQTAPVQLDAEDTIRWDIYLDDRADRIDCYYRLDGGPWVNFDAARPAFERIGYCRPVKNLNLPAGFLVDIMAKAVDEDTGDESGPSQVYPVVWPDVCEFQTRGELLACLGVGVLSPEVRVAG